jgi:hypothetical protein
MLSARPNVGTRVRPVESWNLLDRDVIAWLRGTPLGKQLAEAAAELDEVLSLIPLPDNMLYGRAVKLLKEFTA